MDESFSFADRAAVQTCIESMMAEPVDCLRIGSAEDALASLDLGGAPLLFLIEIQNLEHIGVAYGAAAVSKIVSLVHDALAAVPNCRNLASFDPNLIALVLTAPDARSGAPDADDHADIDRVLRELSRRPFRHGDDIIHLALSSIGRVVDPADGLTPAERLYMMIEGLCSRRGPLAPPRATATWIVAYRQDMKAAAAFYRAARAGRVTLAYQPVVEPAEGWKILYYECLARVIDRDGTMRMPSRFIPALERLNLMRGLDLHIAGLILDELEASPTIDLAFNISAQSAMADGWWHEVMRRLEDRPELAARLVIEVTETAFFHNVSSAVVFCSQVRRLGCRLAIDDFGVGYASLRYLTAFAPDIIKVDAFYVRRLQHGDRELTTLRHLIALAGSFAPVVIVEGVETGAELTKTLLAGANFLQGYQINVPLLSRPWADDARFAPSPEAGTKVPLAPAAPNRQALSADRAPCSRH